MIWISNSLRCTPCRTCCSSKLWRFWWRVRTGGSAATQSLNRHGNSWNIWRACLCCAASGETSAGNTKRQKTLNETHSCSFVEVVSQSRHRSIQAAEDGGSKTGWGERQLIFTCRLDSWVKAFSHPGWAHLYGRSPVWILKQEKWGKH